MKFELLLLLITRLAKEVVLCVTEKLVKEPLKKNAICVVCKKK